MENRNALSTAKFDARHVQKAINKAIKYYKRRRKIHNNQEVRYFYRKALVKFYFRTNHIAVKYPRLSKWIGITVVSRPSKKELYQLIDAGGLSLSSWYQSDWDFYKDPPDVVENGVYSNVYCRLYKLSILCDELLYNHKSTKWYPTITLTASDASDIFNAGN